MVPFKPGDEWRGNRNGRPKGSISLTTLIRRALESDAIGGEKTPDGRTVAEWLVDNMVKQAMKGNPAYMKEIMDRMDGKQRATAEGDEPVDTPVPADDHGDPIEP